MKGPWKRTEPVPSITGVGVEKAGPTRAIIAGRQLAQIVASPAFQNGCQAAAVLVLALLVLLVTLTRSAA